MTFVFSTLELKMKASSTLKISFSANWTLPNINPDRKTNEYNNDFKYIDSL